MQYLNCNDDHCGEYKSVNPSADGIYGVDNLNYDTEPQFKSLSLKVTKEFTEQQWIGKKVVDAKICAHHHYPLGVRYKSKKTCQHPKHKGQSKQRKAVPTRIASLTVIDFIKKMHLF